MENRRPPVMANISLDKTENSLKTGRKKAMTFPMTASSVVAAAATEPAKFQNIRRFASWNEEKTLFL